MVSACAPLIQASHACRTVGGFGARSAPRSSWRFAAALQDFASASRAKVLRIFFPSRGEKTDASYPALQRQRSPLRLGQPGGVTFSNARRHQRPFFSISASILPAGSAALDGFLRLRGFASTVQPVPGCR